MHGGHEEDGTALEPESAAAAAEAAEVAEAAAVLQAAALDAAKEEMAGWESPAAAGATDHSSPAGHSPGAQAPPRTPGEVFDRLAAPGTGATAAANDAAVMEAVAARHHKELAQAELLRKVCVHHQVARLLIRCMQTRAPRDHAH